MESHRKTKDISGQTETYLMFLLLLGLINDVEQLSMIPVKTPVRATNGDSKFVPLQVQVDELIQAPYYVFYYDHALGNSEYTSPSNDAIDGIYTYNAAPIRYILISSNVTFFVSRTLNGERNVSTDVTLMLEDLVVLADLPTKIYKLDEDSGFEAWCSATGNPPPNIRWKYSDDIENLQQTDGEFTDPIFISDVTANKTLTLLSSKVLSFDNTGNYTCEAENSIENNTKTRKVHGRMELLVHIPVEFWSKSDDINATIHQSTILTCTFRSFPPPNETSWKFNGNEKLGGSIFVSDEIFTTMYLELSLLQCEDEGNYSCEATNYVLEDEIKQRSSSTITNRFSAPPPVNNVSANDHECDGSLITVSWDPPMGWTTDLSYKLSVDPGGRSYMTEEESKTLSTDLNTTYNIKVTAVTPCNKTSDEKSVNITTSAITFPSEPQDVVAANDTNGIICSVTWKEPNITHNVSGYKIAYTARNIGDNSISEENSSCTYDIQQMFYEINMTKPNSDYTVTVSAINCAGEGESANAKGTCRTKPKDRSGNDGNEVNLVAIIVPIVVVVGIVLGAGGSYFYVTNKKKKKKKNENVDHTWQTSGAEMAESSSKNKSGGVNNPGLESVSKGVYENY